MRNSDPTIRLRVKYLLCMLMVTGIGCVVEFSIKASLIGLDNIRAIGESKLQLLTFVTFITGIIVGVIWHKAVTDD